MIVKIELDLSILDGERPVYQALNMETFEALAEHLPQEMTFRFTERTVTTLAMGRGARPLQHVKGDRYMCKFRDKDGSCGYETPISMYAARVLVGFESIDKAYTILRVRHTVKVLTVGQYRKSMFGLVRSESDSN